MSQGSVPLTSAIKFLSPDRRKYSAKGVGPARLRLVKEYGHVIDSQYIQVNVHFLQIIAFVCLIPAFRPVCQGRVIMVQDVHITFFERLIKEKGPSQTLLEPFQHHFGTLRRLVYPKTTPPLDQAHKAHLIK